MRIRTLTGGLAAALVLSCPALTGPVPAAAVPSARAVQPQVTAARVLTYDARAAAEFGSAVDRGAAIWNASVDGVELRPAASGERADIQVVADDGWPRSVPESLGRGTVYIGRQAVAQGHSTVRIAAHELGHMLGLPDRKPGPCSSLMSGASAGTSCTNANPSAAERAQVEKNFAGASEGASEGALSGALG